MIEREDLLNYERAEWVLRQNNLDAMLAALPENWLYLTGQEDTIAGTLALASANRFTFCSVRSIPGGMVVVGLVKRKPRR